MNVDPNDPETKREIDAYLEHEKHESAGELAQDLGNRLPAWVWALATVTALSVLAAIAKACT